MVGFAELFVDALDSNLARRRRELIDLRLMVSASAGSRLDLLTRTCQVMAYAHWEGFVKYALSSYLDYLNSLNLPIRELRFELQGLALRSEIKDAVAPERDIVRLATMLARLSQGRLDGTFAIDSGDVLKLGNLTAEKFATVLHCAGLAYSAQYQARENYIDSVLCGRRHRIAHGGLQPISSDDARSVTTDVLDLLDDVNQQIQEAAIYERYRLGSPQ